MEELRFIPQKYGCSVLWSTTTFYDVVTLWFQNIVIDAVYNVVYNPVYNVVLQYCLQCSKQNYLKSAHLVYNPVYNVVTMWFTLGSTKRYTKRLTTWSIIQGIPEMVDHKLLQLSVVEAQSILQSHVCLLLLLATEKQTWRLINEPHHNAARHYCMEQTK